MMYSHRRNSIVHFSFNQWLKYVLLDAGDIMTSKTDVAPHSSLKENTDKAEMTAVQCELCLVEEVQDIRAQSELLIQI